MKRALLVLIVSLVWLSGCASTKTAQETSLISERTDIKMVKSQTSQPEILDVFGTRHHCHKD